MFLTEAAQRLAELGKVTRLSIFHLLIKAGPDWFPVKEIQGFHNVQGSILSQHIRRSTSVGLVVQTLYC